MPKYNLTISFDTSRELTEEELGYLQHDCVAQIDEPYFGGEPADFSTSIIGSDIDEVQEEYACGMCGGIGNASDGTVTQDSPDHKSFICKYCGGK